MRGFETTRLLARALEDRDEQLYCDLFADADAMRFVGSPWSREAAQRAFRAARRVTERLAADRDVFLTLVEKAAHQAIGLCSIQDIDAAARQAELGLMLKPVACGRGFAKETLAAATSWAFRVLPIDELHVRFATTHATAERVALGTGYTRNGYATQPEAMLSSWSARRDSWEISSGRGRRAGVQQEQENANDGCDRLL
jgi:RimJ/RimL family protein N-acetyltransferase